MASTVDPQRVEEFCEEGTPEFERKLDILAEMIKESTYTVFYTGAGVSTSSGVGDYRGPTGVWTKDRIAELEDPNYEMTEEEKAELAKYKQEAEKELQKSEAKSCMLDAQPTPTHMAMSTMIRTGIAHYVVTTNLDGLYRKSGLQDHTQLSCLHGDVFIERCTSCGYDFERNYNVRQDYTHVHDHMVGDCSRCGSKTPEHYRGIPGPALMISSKWGGLLVGTRDVNCGTKDTHVNFGEYLDQKDIDESELHCGKADLCIIVGSSMSLRAITRIPFLAKKTVMINLQKTPDDSRVDLRIWSRCDPAFHALMERLNCPIDPIPIWRPRDAVPIDQLPEWLDSYYVEKAIELEKRIKQMEEEASKG